MVTLQKPLQLSEQNVCDEYASKTKCYLYRCTSLLTFIVCIVGHFLPLKIQSPDEFLEGHESKVVCTASYTCGNDMPTLRWNYDQMPATKDFKNLSKTEWNAVSTLAFTASANDLGKSLTCYAQFPGGQTLEVSTTLQVKSK